MAVQLYGWELRQALLRALARDVGDHPGLVFVPLQDVEALLCV